MKFKRIFSIMAAFLISGLAVACSNSSNDINKYYNLPKDNVLVFYDDVDKLLNDIEYGTHYVYFGKADCPFCQAYLPYYNEAAKKAGQTILYFNVDTVNKLTETKDENGYITLEKDPRYEKITSYWYNYTKPRMVEDSEGRAPHVFNWLYVPKLFKEVNNSTKGMVDEAPESFGALVKDENGHYTLNSLQAKYITEELEKLFA